MGIEGQRFEPACKAEQYSDTMWCEWCGLSWNTNDPDPPRCGLLPPLPRRRINLLMAGALIGSIALLVGTWTVLYLLKYQTALWLMGLFGW